MKWFALLLLIFTACASTPDEPQGWDEALPYCGGEIDSN